MVTMPSLSRHHFHSLASIGFRRLIYHPPESHGAYIRDFDSDGRLLHVLHPSGHRRVTFYYDQDGRPDVIVHDWTDVVFRYHTSSGAVASETLTERSRSSNYTCVLTYDPAGMLVERHIVSFPSSDLGFINATFRYGYDRGVRLTSLDATIADRVLRSVTYNYTVDTGRHSRVQLFTFEHPRAYRDVVRDANIEIVHEFDRHGRRTDVWYRFNNNVVFNLEVKYDAAGRVHQWRRKVGSSDLKPYEYLYDIDGGVVEVLVSGHSTWKYETDANNNIIRIAHHGNARTVVVNGHDRVESSGQESYIFDQDGFLVQRDRETYEYDSFGQLIRAFEPSRYDVRYFYDARRRLTARRESTGGTAVQLVQFFYADLTHPGRLTHIYDGAPRSRITELFYDNRGTLFAMKRDGDYYYIGLDPNGSPIVLLNSIGSAVKIIEYDPLGHQISDSASDFLFHLGFQCGFIDRTTRLLFLNNKVYDPQIGRWTVPRYDLFIDNVERLAAFPEMTNLYRNVFLWKKNLESMNLMTGTSCIPCIHSFNKVYI